MIPNFMQVIWVLQTITETNVYLSINISSVSINTTDDVTHQMVKQHKRFKFSRSHSCCSCICQKYSSEVVTFKRNRKKYRNASLQLLAGGRGSVQEATNSLRNKLLSCRCTFVTYVPLIINLS